MLHFSLCCLLGFSVVSAPADALERGFANPPACAKPRVYWWWLFNRVDKAGITRDLEQFKAKGISGVNLMCVGGYAGLAPLPGVKYQSPEWWELFRHAVKEARRLDIELGFNLSAGGWVMEGPWVTPDFAMKKVVQADLNLEGPRKFSAKLPQPETVDGYYHDYCVQAIPRKAGAIHPDEILDLTSKLQPDGRLEWEVPEGQWTILRTGYTLTTEGQFKFPYPNGDTFKGGNGYQIDYLSTAAFDDHFAHLGRPLLEAAAQAGGRLAYFWSDSWECGKLTWTQDFPNQFRRFRGYDLKPYLPALEGAIRWVNYAATFTATAATQTLAFVGTALAGGDQTVFIDNVQIRSRDASLMLADFGFEAPRLGDGNFQYHPANSGWSFSIENLTGESPSGSGIVADRSRFGNPNAPQGSQAAFVQGRGKISRAITGLTPGAECSITFSAAQRPGNAQTWNVCLDDAVIGTFKPKPGVTLLNEEVTARFRADFARTIQDCVAENFYGHFADICHRHGLSMGSEAAGPNNIPPQDGLRNLGRCDIPAGEFWVNGHHRAAAGYNQDPRLRLNLKQTASAAHTYGRREAQAESFSQQEPDRTHWSLGPADLRPYANDAFCEGINRLMLHQATCQPPSDGKPGYEFCAGQHWNPNMTWWEQSAPFFTYLARCSFLLQQGNFVGDVCFYLGEDPPVLAPPKYVVPSLGPGYDCDYFNKDVLLNRMTLRNGRITLPDGMSYHLMVLQNCTSPLKEICHQVGAYQGLSVSPIPSRAMSIEVLKKIRELLLAGATVIGAPPEKAAELKDYPNCDQQVQALAAELWAGLDGKTTTEKRVGKGRLIWGKTAREVLAQDSVTPDFTYPGQMERPDSLDFIHRTLPDAEIYFVINRKNQPQSLDCEFRVRGRQPEIWDPVTGGTRKANAFRQTERSTILPLEFVPFGSYFVVFRNRAAAETGPAASNSPRCVVTATLTNTWSVAFDPAWGGPASASFPELISWTRRPEPGIRFYSGLATYRQTFDAPQDLRKLKKGGRAFLDLGNVRHVAVVRLNGKNLGVLWTAPWRVDITGLLKKTGNRLEIDVINLWANRVIGDLGLPKEQRVTRTHDAFRFDMLRKSTPLLDSGLHGPVTLQRASN